MSLKHLPKPTQKSAQNIFLKLLETGRTQNFEDIPAVKPSKAPTSKS